MSAFGKNRLYLVTSQELSRGRSSPEVIRSALAGGVRLVQLREKSMEDGELFRLAREARRLTREVDALLIINDRLDVAMGCDADGVHLGRGDIPVDVARQVAPGLIVGASAHSAAEVLDAQARGASYVNIGPLFATSTKEGWEGRYLGLEGLKTISKAAVIPFTVMGGIKKEHIAGIVGAGAGVIAVVTAITMADDPEQATRELLAEVERSSVTAQEPWSCLSAAVRGGHDGTWPSNAQKGPILTKMGESD